MGHCLRLFIADILVFLSNEEMKCCFEHIAVIFDRNWLKYMEVKATGMFY